MVTGFALVLAAGFDVVAIGATATRTDGSTACLMPANGTEKPIRLILIHPVDGFEAQRASFC